MVTMMNSLRCWNSAAFEQALKEEMEALRGDVLPLAQAVGRGNRVYDNDLGVTLLEAAEFEEYIEARVGVFFAEIISCVSCGEGDPIDEAYCELEVRIDRQSGEAQFRLRAQ